MAGQNLAYTPNKTPSHAQLIVLTATSNHASFNLANALSPWFGGSVISDFDAAVDESFGMVTR
ncbi:hypothetical protein DKY63_03585 [Pseudomonas putida]|uniref:Uncharacterized protein n=1 Tax=Pseudomonas putida TaxID=303 RepID=A0A2Z4RD22_PSEPU|nr:hypothetical protein DKY63_03585 [Pseudomonas putida]